MGIHPDPYRLQINLLEAFQFFDGPIDGGVLLTKVELSYLSSGSIPCVFDRERDLYRGASIEHCGLNLDVRKLKRRVGETIAERIKRLIRRFSYPR